MQNLHLLQRDRSHPWRVAVLDADSPSRARLTDVAKAAGATVCVSGVPRPDIASLILQTACDVVLLGIDVPEPRSLQLAATIQCPVVLCSGDASSSMIAKAQRVKAMAFLVRPIRPDQLGPTIAVAVARFQEQSLLQRTLEERKLVERAKGCLMTLNDMSEEDAFRWLRRRAMDTQSRLADVARKVLEAQPDRVPVERQLRRGAPLARRSPS